MSEHLQNLAKLLQALAQAPHDIKRWCQVGFTYTQIGDPAEALATFQSARQIVPDYPEAYFGEALVYRNLGDSAASLNSLRQALRYAPNEQRFFSAYAQALSAHSAPAEEIGAAYRDWAARFADPLRPKHRAPARQRTKGEKIRIGYVSADFRQHALMSFFAPLLEHHNREQFQLIAFSSTVPDETTADIQYRFDHWNDVRHLNDKALAELIRRCGIDILVDLSGHTNGTRLLALARQPAPCQITWYGYNSTTGMSTMDFRLTDAVMDPLDTPSISVETLIHLPHFTCYRPPSDAPPVGDLPALRNGYITYGSLNGFHKLSDSTLTLWAQLLTQQKTARLIVVGSHAALAGAESENLVRQRLTKNGLPLERVTVLPIQSMTEFMALGEKIDIALESFPLTGGVTTCHTLWMALPTFALRGQTPDSRAAAAILTAASRKHWIADTVPEYLSLARRWVADLEALSKERQGLRQHLQNSPLMDEIGFIRDLERRYLSCLSVSSC